MGFFSNLLNTAADAAGIDLEEVKENLKGEAEEYVDEL